MASEMFNKLAEGKHEAVSAGTTVIDLERGLNREGKKIKDTESASHVVQVMDELGIDILNNPRHQVPEQDLEQVDIVVVMTEPETTPEFLKKQTTIYWSVKDPYQQTPEETRKIRDQIAGLVTELYNTIEGEKHLTHIK